MRPAPALAGALALPLLLVGLGCPSAYQRSYDQETQRLEQEQAEKEAGERAAHEQAQKYAAVVYFDVGSAVIKEAGYRELEWFVQQLQPYPQAVIEVRGFADSTGSETRNQVLSQQRADAVARYLAGRGIDSSRIVASGYSENFPAQSNTTAQGRLNNRRVEVTVR